MSPHPSKDGREPLTRERILGKAMELLDGEGVEALTMRRLAREFDVEAMAFYHYFPNKDAILDGLVDAAVREAAEGELQLHEDWRDTMRDGILAVRRAFVRHPNIVYLVTRGASESQAALVWAEGPLAILYGAGLRGRDLVAAYHQILAYVFGWHLMAGKEGMGVWASGEGLAEQAPAAASVGPELGDWSFGFEEGLDVLLDGIAGRVKTAG